MPLENEMKTPKAFGNKRQIFHKCHSDSNSSFLKFAGGNVGVLNRSMILIIFLYVGMGFFGYLKYGANIKGSITLNLPQNELYVENKIRRLETQT